LKEIESNEKYHDNYFGLINVTELVDKLL